jgi:hypothetical protein
MYGPSPLSNLGINLTNAPKLNRGYRGLSLLAHARTYPIYFHSSIETLTMRRASELIGPLQAANDCRENAHSYRASPLARLTACDLLERVTVFPWYTYLSRRFVRHC